MSIEQIKPYDLEIQFNMTAKIIGVIINTGVTFF